MSLISIDFMILGSVDVFGHSNLVFVYVDKLPLYSKNKDARIMKILTISSHKEN